MNNLTHWIATSYIQAGLSIIPIKLDGSKKPALPSWNAFRERFATETELKDWFSLPRGIGIVTGIQSGGLEVLDFDDGSLFPAWFLNVKAIAEKLTIISTPSGGYHVLYRCVELGGNVKIAMDTSKEKSTLIESRGEGGYILSHGSPRGVHGIPKTYDIASESGCYLPTVKTITTDARRHLWAAARAFDLRPTAERQKLIAKYREPHKQQTSGSVHPVVLEFNNRNDWDSILRPHGWTSADGVLWCRPGKQHGTSGKVVQTSDGAEVLTVFSGNAGPLSPTGSNRTINKFDARRCSNMVGTADQHLKKQGGHHERKVQDCGRSGPANNFDPSCCYRDVD